MQASVHTFDEQSRSGSVLLDDGTRLEVPTPVVEASALRHLRVGQRVSIETSEGTVTRLWIVGIGEGEVIR